MAPGARLGPPPEVEGSPTVALQARAAAEKAAGPAEPCGEYRPNLQAKFTNGAPDCQCGFARDLHSKAALGEEEEAAPEDTGPTAAEAAAPRGKSVWPSLRRRPLRARHPLHLRGRGGASAPRRPWRRGVSR